MKIKHTIIITLTIVIAISTILLVRHTSHSTNEAVRRRAVMAYYHTIVRSAEKREAARYLLDNMPYHYGYGVTVRDSKAVSRWAKATTATLRDLLDGYGLYQIPGDTVRALREVRRADSLAMQRIDQDVRAAFPNDVNDTHIYNIRGERMTCGRKELSKGIYIQNGKKFIVK